MKHRLVVARALAHAFLSGPWVASEMSARARSCLALEKAPWAGRLAASACKTWRTAPLHDLRTLERWIEAHPTFDTVWRETHVALHVHRWFISRPAMGRARWAVPTLSTEADLAAWLDLDPEQLGWFADTRGLERITRATPLQHYRCTWLDRPALLPRLLEAPKPRLLALQRKVLHDVLEKIPPHDAAHGFVPGRSAVTHAALHVGRQVVVRFDLETFFTTITASRAHAVFRAAGYPHRVASLLTGLCTTRTPAVTLRQAPGPWDDGDRNARRHALLSRLAAFHLPQGAPTSPALANLSAWKLDLRLTSLAASTGLTYSRYADDLTFSSDQLGDVRWLCDAVREVVRDEGFRLNAHKTRVMRKHQRQLVTGVVVNERLGFGRKEFDVLKAQVHRAVLQGVSEEEFEVLQGKVAWVRSIHQARGEKLRVMLGKVRGFPSPRPSRPPGRGGL